MKQVFSREGWRALAGSWIVLVLSIIAAGVIAAASHWYRDREMRETRNAAQRLEQARARVQSARRERDSLEESADVFRTLVDRGLLQSEKRLDLVEMVNDLRTRHQLFSLDYEIAPQRPLTLAAGRAYPSVDVLASRVRIRTRALHEGDILGFIDDITRSRQGFYTVDRCRMRRLESAGSDVLVPRVEAECSLEWITLREKRAPNPPA
ncbi:MAG TPA: hypothetical protein VFP36_05470 [Usitatibacter sp.]|nr:hypothetical protein [Usitatibacter sp.]